MIEVSVKELAGSFAENKDVAKDVRENMIVPALAGGEIVVLDFKGVDSTTQSFVHALVSNVFQTVGENALALIEFRNCRAPVKSLITTVINYSLE
jgi:hypothetical protein